MKKYILIIGIFFFLNGCDVPRDLIVPTHLTRVPKPYNLTAKVDSTVTGKILINLKWDCDDNGNLKDFEVSRAYLKGVGDTSQFYPIPPEVSVKAYADSTIDPLTVDSLYYFYHINANGIDKFYGPASDFVAVKLIRKN